MGESKSHMPTKLGENRIDPICGLGESNKINDSSKIVFIVYIFMEI